MKMQLHILTPVFLLVSSLFFLFSTDHPLAICGVFLLAVYILAGNRQWNQLKQGLWFAVPMTLFMLLFNLIFVTSGMTELVVIFEKRITLESILYALLMGVKLLAAVYLFFTVSCLIDTDRAVSYCGSKLPKSTLTFLLIFRLVPHFKESFFHLKDVYSIRGVEFENVSLRERIKSYRAVLSVLLEQSLESSFEIGEAAYTRGFLSTKRSVYERSKPTWRDVLVFIIIGALFSVYLLILASGAASFNLYFGDGPEQFKNPLWIFYLLLCTILAGCILSVNRKKHKVPTEVIWDT